MNYYSFHIGDYLSATTHLTLLEHGAYRRLLDVYYVNEAHLSSDVSKIHRLAGARTKEEKEAVNSILDEFFTLCDDGYSHDRCDHEIAICNKNRENGKKGGRPLRINNPDATQTEPRNNPDVTQTESPPSPHHPITPSLEASISEQATSTTNTTSTVADISPSSSVKARCKTLADRLGRLESARTSKAVRGGPGHRMAAWVAAGITDNQFQEAYELAVSGRVEAGDNSPVNVGFMDIFVGKVMNPINAPSSVSGVKKAWYETASGIEAKGKELGIPLPTPETGGFGAFKDRVLAAANRLGVAA